MKGDVNEYAWFIKPSYLQYAVHTQNGVLKKRRKSLRSGFGLQTYCWDADMGI